LVVRARNRTFERDAVRSVREGECDGVYNDFFNWEKVNFIDRSRGTVLDTGAKRM
jgi:hypothetical protein